MDKVKRFLKSQKAIAYGLGIATGVAACVLVPSILATAQRHLGSLVEPKVGG